MKIKLFNKIAERGICRFGEGYEVGENVVGAEGIMVRSASLHDLEPWKELLAVARAGAGVNNIPVDKFKEKGIVVFNTPGANANAVKELCISALLLSSRNIVSGIEWVRNLTPSEQGIAKDVEKGKAAFAGCEILGKTLGVVGLGAIGGLVANSARALDMNVIGFDPFLTVNAAWNLSGAIKRAENYDQIYAESDYITLHLPLNDSTKGMINKNVISQMKRGVKLINLSRAELVSDEALEEALQSGQISCYVTDFPTEKIRSLPNTICIPHLGASTVESEDNCAVMASDCLKEYLETGNVTNSVNYPPVSIPKTNKPRVCVCHHNVANMIARITAAISSRNINIENMANGSKGDYAYTIIEIDLLPSDAVLADILSIEGVVKVRLVK